MARNRDGTQGQRRKRQLNATDSPEPSGLVFKSSVTSWAKQPARDTTSEAMPGRISANTAFTARRSIAQAISPRSEVLLVKGHHLIQHDLDRNGLIIGVVMRPALDQDQLLFGRGGTFDNLAAVAISVKATGLFADDDADRLGQKNLGQVVGISTNCRGLMRRNRAVHAMQLLPPLGAIVIGGLQQVDIGGAGGLCRA